MADPAFWNKIAAKYAAQPIEDPEGYEASLNLTRAHLRPTDRMLEIGCGTGDTARTLSRHCAYTVATDISPAMIAVGEARSKTDPGHVLTLRVAEAEDLQPEAPFDVICAFNLLHLVDDLPTTLRALHDQLKPGGKLISKTPSIGEASILIRLLIPVMQLFGKAPHVLNLTLSDLRDQMRDAGFREIEYSDFSKKTGRHFLVVERV